MHSQSLLPSPSHTSAQFLHGRFQARRVSETISFSHILLSPGILLALQGGLVPGCWSGSCRLPAPQDLGAPQRPPASPSPTPARALSQYTEGALLRSEAQLEHTVWHSHGDGCCWQ